MSSRIDANRRLRIEKSVWGKVPFFREIDVGQTTRFLGVIGVEGQLCLSRENSSRAKALIALAVAVDPTSPNPTEEELTVLRGLAASTWVKASFEGSGRMNLTLPETIMSAANILSLPSEIFIYSAGDVFEIWSQPTGSRHLAARAMPEMLRRLSSE